MCDYSDNFVGNIWKHKFEDHASESFNINMDDEKSRQEFMFNLLAEQNTSLKEEITSIKEVFKEALEQVTNNFGDIIVEMKNDNEKYHVKTSTALSTIQNKIKNVTAFLKQKDVPKVSAESSSFKQPSSSSSSSAARPPPQEECRPEINKSEKRKQKQTKYQSKPRILVVGDSLAHNTNFRRIEVVTNTTIKTVKAYSSVRDESSRFKDKNVKDVVNKELKGGNYSHLVLAAPTVDISNLKTEKVQARDNVETFKHKTGISC